LGCARPTHQTLRLVPRVSGVDCTVVAIIVRKSRFGQYTRGACRADGGLQHLDRARAKVEGSERLMTRADIDEFAAFAGFDRKT
jgi:hypothetical protein